MKVEDGVFGGRAQSTEDKTKNSTVCWVPEPTCRLPVTAEVVAVQLGASRRPLPAGKSGGTRYRTGGDSADFRRQTGARQRRTAPRSAEAARSTADMSDGRRCSPRSPSTLAPSIASPRRVSQVWPARCRSQSARQFALQATQSQPMDPIIARLPFHRNQLILGHEFSARSSVTCPVTRAIARGRDHLPSLSHRYR